MSLFYFPFSQRIYTTLLQDNATAEVFIQAESYIDGLTYSDSTRTLYWTTFEAGQIVSMNVDDKIAVIMKSDLDMPRAITIDEDSG
jgi:uncharacterized protein YjiK